MMVTGEQVREAVMAAGLTDIPHHDCGLCGEWVAYQVHNGDLYFNPACGCSWSPTEPRTWDSAANWINMQSNEGARAQIMAKFGMTPNDRVEGRDAALSRRVPSHDGLCGNGNYNERAEK